MQTYLTPHIPGTGGEIKETPEDFLVAEIPLYLPSGEGEHTYVEIEKRGITTLEAIRRIARAVGLPEREIGYAGMKDAKALTRQTLSVPRTPPQQLLALEIPGIRFLSAQRHRNKLKMGHLFGNRFRIRVRGTAEGARERAQAVLEVLVQRGVPNRFGEQRYGGQGNSHLIGGALLRNDFRGAVDALMGDPDKVRTPDWKNAIIAWRKGNPEECLRLLPGACRGEREVVKRLVDRPGEWERALRGVDPRLKTLYLNAFQSYLFDRVLEERLPDLDRIEEGDLAWKHANGACFLVTDPDAEAPRVAAFEISPTGPLFGGRMTRPAGAVLARENQILTAEGLTLADFDLPGKARMDGERRPLRVPLSEPAVEYDPEGLVISFALPRGSYATSVLREVMKTG